MTQPVNDIAMHVVHVKVIVGVVTPVLSRRPLNVMEHVVDKVSGVKLNTRFPEEFVTVPIVPFPEQLTDVGVPTMRRLNANTTDVYGYPWVNGVVPTNPTHDTPMFWRENGNCVMEYTVMSDEYVRMDKIGDKDDPVVHENWSWFWDTTRLVMVPPFADGVM